MAAAIGKYAANKMLKGELAKYAKKPVAGDTVRAPPFDPMI